MIKIHCVFVLGYNKDELADDDKPLSILGYLNGGGFDDHLEVHKDEVSRIDIREWTDGLYTDFETRSVSPVCCVVLILILSACTLPL